MILPTYQTMEEEAHPQEAAVLDHRIIAAEMIMFTEDLATQEEAVQSGAAAAAVGILVAQVAHLHQRSSCNARMKRKNRFACMTTSVSRGAATYATTANHKSHRVFPPPRRMAIRCKGALKAQM